MEREGVTCFIFLGEDVCFDVSDNNKTYKWDFLVLTLVEFQSLFVYLEDLEFVPAPFEYFLQNCENTSLISKRCTVHENFRNICIIFLVSRSWICKYFNANIISYIWLLIFQMLKFITLLIIDSYIVSCIVLDR